jgi:MFS family permease
MWTVAGGIGPVLGGIFTEYVSWRWVFWVQPIISSIAFLLLLFFLDVHNPKTKFVDGVKAIDWFGSFSILALMVMLLLGLNFGGVILPWNSATVICLIVFGMLMLFFFIVSESRLARYPIMPLDLFHHKSNVACLVVGFIHDFVSARPTVH